MTQCTDLLSSLSRKGIRLWLEGDQLRYRSAKGALSPAELEALRSMKHEVVQVISHCEELTATVALAEPRDATLDAPLTLQQTWMWHSIRRGGLSYLNAFVFHISGPLDPQLLSRSYEALVRRHDSLRMRIVPIDGVPRVQVDPPTTQMCRLQMDDLSHLSQEDADIRVRQAVEKLSHHDCDLALGPLFDARLLKLAELEYLFIPSAHHIVSDAFALALLFRELWTLYSGLARGRPGVLPQPAAQYADYALWQHANASSPSQRHEDYWRERLRGAAPIQWPVDICDTGGTKVGLYEHVPISFGRLLTGRLREVAGHEGTTLALTVLAVYVAFLCRWCSQTDVIVAISVTGRDRPELESMAGYCAYALYLRMQLASDTTFSRLVTEASQEFFQALAHGDFSCAVARNPDLHAHALFQWVSWPLEEPGQILAPLGIKAEWLPTKVALRKADPFSQYDFMPALWETDEGIVGAIHCRTAALPAAQRFTEDLLACAEEFARNPYRSILAS